MSPSLVQLEMENYGLLDRLLALRDELRRNGDFRWFFTHAHACITGQILGNLACFRQPERVLRVNRHFTKAYLNAVAGPTPLVWQQAFDSCRDLERRSARNPLLLGEIEQCEALMAYAHIDTDLRQALRDEGGTNPQDYANILPLIHRGQLAATTEVRGLWGIYEFPLLNVMGRLVGAAVEQWRNTVFTETNGLDVPDVEPDFSQCLK